MYGELGRYPLYINRYVRIIKYWLKIVKTNNILLRVVYLQALADSNNGYSNWVTNVRKLLSDFGFAYVFDTVHNVNVNAFVHELRCRIIDTFKQEWYGSLCNISVLDMYKIFKNTFQYEDYLNMLPRKYRYYLCRLRMSVHPLRIQTGRYARNNIQRNERYCICCNQLDIEDEFHFVCICPCYIVIRQKYIKRHYYVRPSVFKFHELLNSVNRCELIKLCNYVKESLCIRNAILNNAT